MLDEPELTSDEGYSFFITQKTTAELIVKILTIIDEEKEIHQVQQGFVIGALVMSIAAKFYHVQTDHDFDTLKRITKKWLDMALDNMKILRKEGKEEEDEC